MTLAQLKTACAAYLQKTTSDLTVDSVDLFLVAANNARKNGELLHDFEHARVTAALSIDGVTGASLTDAVIVGDGADTIAVTGTLSPDATGTYVRSGNFGGYPFYVRSGSTSYFLYYNAALATFVIAASLTTASVSNAWIPSVVQLVATGTFVGGGVNTGTATAAGSSATAFSGIKSIVAVSRQRPDGTYIPLDFARADIPIERDRTELEFSDNLFPYLRYPSDAQINARGTNSSLIQRGNTLAIHPVYATSTTTTFAVLLEAYGWLRDYVAADLSATSSIDFFLSNGFSYMQWATICELNYLTQTFVDQRVEGVLAPPTKMRDDAWNRFLLWDSYLVDANSTRSR